MTTTHVMKVSSNGQISIPAAVRTRWNVNRVVVVDLGDRVVLRPLPPDPVAQLQGKYRERGPTTDGSRHEARVDDDAEEMTKMSR